MTLSGLAASAANRFRKMCRSNSPDEEIDLEAHRLNFDEKSWPRQHQRHYMIRKVRGPKENVHSYRVNLTELQQLHLKQLQCKLLQHAVHLSHGVTEPPGWANDMRQYVQALQDIDYMQDFIWQTTDPFVISGERVVDRYMLDTALKGHEREYDSQRSLPPMMDWEDESQGVRIPAIAGTRDRNLKEKSFKAFRGRLALAALGAIFLIAPMWLMVLHNTLYTTLIATTVFIIIFGFLMALSPARPMEVMASTAAYAAVLVVFVGLNVDTGSGDAA